MSFFRSQWSNLGNMLVTRAGGIVPPPDCRYYYNFDGIDDYIGTSSISITGDFELNVDIKTTQTLSDFAISDGQSFSTGIQGESLFYVDNPDGLQLIIGNGAGAFDRYVFGGQADIADGVNNTIKLVRAGNNVSAFLGSTQIGATQNIVSPLVIFEGLWFGGAGREMEGVGSNLKIWTGGDSQTGTLIHSYAINDNSTTIVDSVGGQNGTLINGDPASWEYICENSSDWDDGESWNDGDSWID